MLCLSIIYSAWLALEPSAVVARGRVAVKEIRRKHGISLINCHVFHKWSSNIGANKILHLRRPEDDSAKKKAATGRVNAVCI